VTRITSGRAGNPYRGEAYPRERAESMARFTEGR